MIEITFFLQVSIEKKLFEEARKHDFSLFKNTNALSILCFKLRILSLSFTKITSGSLLRHFSDDFYLLKVLLK